jgi:hypothetical protein
MRTIFTWVVLIIILVGGAYLGSPWWAVWNLDRAAKAMDSHAIESAVDFPAVRASLSPGLNAKLQSAMDREKAKPHSVFDKLLMFGRSLIQPKVADTVLTPQGVTYMLKTAAPPPWSNPFEGQKAPPPGEPSLDLGHSGYMDDDLDQFHATIDNKIHPERAVSLKLLRRGFITWKVVSLDLVTVAAPAPAAAGAGS